MRKEPFTVGSYIHVVKRGARGMPIVRDESDRWRFLLMLRHFNDSSVSEYWFKSLTFEKKSDTFERASVWPKQKKIVEILSYCLLENHFHLLLREVKEGGVTEFMKRLGLGMSMHFNEKYEEKGSLFQGAYKSRTIESDTYLRYVAVYIMLKNTLDMYPGGLEKSAKEFEKAYEWAIQYPYSSLGEYNGVRESDILDKGILAEVFPNSQELKTFSLDFMKGKYAKSFLSSEYTATPFE